jgi:hypothetical protein
VRRPAWAARLQRQRRKGLLFLVAIGLPSLLLVVLSLRMLAQERELVEKRVADARRLLAAEPVANSWRDSSA